MDPVIFLAELLRINEDVVISGLRARNNYEHVPIKKKGGGIRHCYKPQNDLRKLQRVMLRRFFYRIPVGGAPYILYAFRPGLSYVFNAERHACVQVGDVWRIDFKNAFPSVRGSDLRVALKALMSEEIKRAFRESDSECRYYPIGSSQKFQGMLRMARCDPIFQEDFYQFMDNLIELLISLTTYNGRLVQGAPTSPYLMNIFLWYSGLVQRIYEYLRIHGVFVRRVLLLEQGGAQEVVFTIYSDDLVLSASDNIPWEVIKGLIDLIEQSSPFRINRRKLRRYKPDRIAPMVTGLRVVRLERSKGMLVKHLKERGFEPEEARKQAKGMLNKRKKWVVASISLPKREIRKIRAMIHGATGKPELRKELGPKIQGHIARLHDVYGLVLPRQIAIPYAAYQAAINRSINKN